MSNQKLRKKVDKVRGLFNIEDVSHLDANTPERIASYYKTNKLAYKIFHSKTDFIHMGLSENDTYSESDLYKQAEIVEAYFEKNTENILEIGCGKGKNIEFLAKRYPTINFYGVDLEGGQTDIATDRAKKLSNLQVEYGDYHNLSQLSDVKFDIVFVIEALCHSSNKGKVAHEVHKLLKETGLFIVFDGYLGVETNSLDSHDKIACELVEKGMMVDKFENYNVVKNKILKQGFELNKEKDFSKNILPTLCRFEKLANLAFNLGIISRILIKALPSNLANNAISGFLMPNLIQTGIAKYYLSVFKKA